MTDLAEHAILPRMLDWLKARLARDRELQDLTPHDYDTMAADIGVTPEQFHDLAPRIDDHSDQMDAMIRAQGLEPRDVRRAFGGLRRDMEVLCAQCRSPARCRRELAAGTAAARMHDFCVNAAAIDDMARRA